LLGDARLITLAGAGGVGKTRLALRIGTHAQSAFEHGVWLVELASEAQPTAVARRVAATLQVHEVVGESLEETLVSKLRQDHGQRLVILDNCEHLLDACAVLCDRLLRASAELRILVTSRQPLGIDGETIWLVQPLGVPSAELMGSDEIAASEAVRLFRDRARSALPTSH
jgi:predicted ATPase